MNHIHMIMKGEGLVECQFETISLQDYYGRQIASVSVCQSVGGKVLFSEVGTKRLLY